MNKDIKWLKEELDKSTTGFNGRELSRYEMGRLDGYTHASMLLDELDEQETLSQEWIDRFEQFRAYVQEQRDLSYGVELGATGGYTGRIANQYDGLLEMIEEYEEHNPITLQNLFVPKQGKPVIPRFVADYIELNKGWSEDRQEYIEDDSSGLWFALDGNSYGMPNSVSDWLFNEEKVETFAKAWLDGYEVEKKKKWVVKQRKLYLKSFDIWREECNNAEFVFDKESTIKFTDKVKAEAVALLVNGTVEEVAE